ncbi:MAG TPA: metallophosphoesterase family protein [Bdellovibrionales bacterium]|nr:metallophosphoesterase family protein [Bdellovibrionales bacterium]
MLSLTTLVVLSGFITGCEGPRATGEFDYFRVMWNDDAATAATVGFTPKEKPAADLKLYYDVADHGVEISKYAYSQAVDRLVNKLNMNHAFVRLKNLKPSTKYYFVIADSKSVSPRLWFETASDRPQDRLSLIAGGDSRNNRTPRQNANLLVSKLRPHGVLFGGDMTATGTETQWREWFEDWQMTISPDGRMTPVIMTRGNHETDRAIVSELFDTPLDVYYGVNINGSLLRVYTLNTEISKGGDQAAWLQKDLEASRGQIWKIAQYHRPMRPHTSGKADGTDQYKFWAPLFDKYGMNLVVESDSHTVKSTWPIRPSTGSGSQEGFVRDDAKGTVYIGEGCWGAPLRDADDAKSWTRDVPSDRKAFNHFNWIFLDEKVMQVRTIKVDNAADVSNLTDETRFQLPKNINVWKPANGDVIALSR